MENMPHRRLWAILLCFVLTCSSGSTFVLAQEWDETAFMAEEAGETTATWDEAAWDSEERNDTDILSPQETAPSPEEAFLEDLVSEEEAEEGSAPIASPSSEETLLIEGWEEDFFAADPALPLEEAEDSLVREEEASLTPYVDEKGEQRDPVFCMRVQDRNLNDG